jgi:colanic acid/amylovoran biosynthesis glycosyltransferase
MEEINLAILSPSENAYSETFIQAHKSLKGVNVFYYFGGSLPSKYGMGEELALKGTDKLFFKIRHKLSAASSFMEESVISSFKKNKINCVLAEYGPTGSAVMNICQQLRIPLLVHFHGYDASADFVFRKFSEKYKDMFAYSSIVFAVSKKMTEKLIAIGCPAEKIICNIYGPQNFFFDLKPDYTSQNFIAVCRFVDKKAPYYSILAFEKVHREFPQAKLIMVGAGVLLNVCKNLVKYLYLEDKVIFKDILTPEQIKTEMENSLAFIQHSITALNGDSEGTPVAVLEASAAALPVISTRHAGIPDVIIDGETGFLVEEHDVEGMASAMKEILSDPGLARKMGKKGRERIKKNFTLERHLGIIEEAILRTVNLKA